MQSDLNLTKTDLGTFLKARRDEQGRRDRWLKKMAISSKDQILVGDENVTLGDVHRWLAEAIKNNQSGLKS